MASPLRQSSFVGGEVAPPLHARVDLQAYSSWLKTCRNFIVRPQGGVRNRPGTQLCAGTKDDQKISLLPFVFSQDEAYVLEFGSGYIRFYRDGAQALFTATAPVLAFYSQTVGGELEILDPTTGTNPSVWRSQSFTSSQSIPVAFKQATADISRSGGVCASVQAAIYADSGGLPSVPITGLDFSDLTTLQASSIVGAPISHVFSLVDPLAAPVLLSPATTYHFVVRSNDDGNPVYTALTYIVATTGNGYPQGQAAKFYGGAWVALSGIDLLFSVTGNQPPGVPLEVTTTYTADEVIEIKGRTAQSADVLFIPSHNHNPAELKRQAETSWFLTDLVNSPGTTAPATPVVAGDTAGSAYNPVKSWWWVITAIDGITGSESYGSTPRNLTLNVSSVNPATVTVPAAINGASGYNVYRGRNYGIYGYIGTVNGLIFYDDGFAPDYTQTPTADPNAPVLTDPVTPAPGFLLLSGSGGDPSQGYWYYAATAVAADESFPLSALVVGGTTYPIASNGVSFPVTMVVTAVAGATAYRMYRGRQFGQYGFVATSATTTITDTGSAPNFTLQPPIKIPYQSPGAPPITFQSPGDHPSVACFMDQRLILAGTDNNPDTIYGSRVGNYQNFNASSPAGDDDAFQFTLAALTVDRIKGIIHSRVLMGFTGSSEYTIKGNRDDALGPSSIDAKAQAHYGSGTLAPLPVGGRVLFVQREGKAVREFKFDFQQDGYTADDERSVLAKHMLDGHSIVDWAYAKGPDSVIWMVREDGIILGMTYLPQHDVIAWHTHDTDGLVEAVCCIPEGDQTTVYISVARQVGGMTKRFVERFAPRQIEDVEDGVFLDCSLTYSSPDMSGRILTFSSQTGWAINDTATATITGQNYFVASHVGSQLVLRDSSDNEYRATILTVVNGLVVTVKFDRAIPVELRSPTTNWSHALKVFQFSHMIGETVTALVDGNVVPDLVVDSGGNVTLPFCGSIVTIGKPYVSELKTLDINMDGKGQILKKVVGKVWFDFVVSRGLWVGESEARMNEWKQRKVADGTPNSGQATPQFTGRDYVTISGGWNYNGSVIAQQRDPLPCEIISITPEVTFGG